MISVYLSPAARSVRRGIFLDASMGAIRRRHLCGNLIDLHYSPSGFVQSFRTRARWMVLLPTTLATLETVLVADWAIAEVGPLRGTQRVFLCPSKQDPNSSQRRKQAINTCPVR